MEIEILSLFPEYFRGPFDVSMLKRAIDAGLITIRHTNIRDFAENKHGRVDDRPFGGGPGMVLCPGPVARAIRSCRRNESKVIFLSPQGSKLTASKCEELATEKHLILLCGHYEGVDQRVLDAEIDEEISIGDYVLTNGCVAAIVLIDAMVRFIPGVIGHPEAVQEDSFQEGIFDSPHYTRPEIFEGMKVPEVLLGGHHAEIEKWRKAKAKEKTRRVRPDLLLGEKL
ncbi:MAG: tRNA (guanosine(37)-N1)-methyltransferase TrmD [Parachlamydiales bacterium]|nr:tRNA (guanosine(37)-N1)-methyltransferase TrmD [Parachlamydiales bacterium]